MSLLQFSTDLRDTTLSLAQKYTSFQNFVAYFDTLKVAALGTRVFTDKQLSEHIFKHTWKDSQEVMIVERHLFAAHNTLHRLNAKITVANFNQFESLLTTLSYDLYRMVEYVERRYCNNILNFSMGGRPDQNAREIFDTCRMMLEIARVNPANLYLREVFPVSVFLLRQTIEVYGKRLLGFYSVTNEQGQRTRGVSTQVAWDFIKEETLKRDCRIVLPIDVDIIRKVEEWTNYYVHTGDVIDIFLIENAIQMIYPIIYPQNQTERNYNNTFIHAGTSKIRDYNNVKRDFETYINRTDGSNFFLRSLNLLLIKIGIRKKSKKRVVNWKPIGSVDATIVSL